MLIAWVSQRADHPAHFPITHRHKRAIALISRDPLYPHLHLRFRRVVAKLAHQLRQRCGIARLRVANCKIDVFQRHWWIDLSARNVSHSDTDRPKEDVKILRTPPSFFTNALKTGVFHHPASGYLDIKSAGSAVDSDEAFAFQMQNDLLGGFLG